MFINIILFKIFPYFPAILHGLFFFCGITINLPTEMNQALTLNTNILKLEN